MNQTEPDMIVVPRHRWRYALELLHAFATDEPCNFDHNGWCQDHIADVRDTEGRTFCATAETRRLLAQLGVRPQPAEFEQPDADRFSSIGLIANERARQIRQGHTPVRDAERNPRGELGCAAAALATHPDIRIGVLGNTWPWAVETWPGDGPKGPGISRKEELIRAGALIAAELDRLDVEGAG